MDGTELMRLITSEDPDAEQQAWDVLYPELIALARAQRRKWQGNWTLETRVLAHEAYLKLFRGPVRSFEDDRHFFRLVSRAIRQVLINYAEARGAAKRGGGGEDVTLDERLLGDHASSEAWAEVRELDEAIHRLRDLDPRAAEIVELRFFAGLTNEEIAETLDISLATVGRDWAAAKAWLSRELREEG